MKTSRVMGLTLPALALMAFVMASCTPSSSGSPDASGTSTAQPTRMAAPARIVPDGPRATLPNGSVIALELAITQEEIGQGLMFRPSLPDDRGMLFLFEVERVPSFWMKNTMIPLDLLFLDGDGEVTEIMENAQPCAAEPCPQYIPSSAAWAVLEVAAGFAARHELSAGDSIAFEDVPGYPRRQ